MCVIRIKKTENFVILHKGVLEDERLSFKAKGLWAYCMSRPNDWTFQVSHLKKVSQDGEDSIYSALKELIETGYVVRTQQNKGKFEKMDYEIYETPQIQKILPQPENPQAGESLAEKPALLRIDVNQGLKEEDCLSPAPVGPEEIPKSIKKFNTSGKEIAFELDEIFRRSIQTKKDWQTQEINEAWEILVNYQGRVNDYMAFIDGTIKNLRKKSHIEKLRGEKCKPETKSEEQKRVEEIRMNPRELTQERWASIHKGREYAKQQLAELTGTKTPLYRT